MLNHGQNFQTIVRYVSYNASFAPAARARSKPLHEAASIAAPALCRLDVTDAVLPVRGSSWVSKETSGPGPAHAFRRA
jgi:hypothetical protein